MKLRYKILSAVGLIATAAVTAAAVTLSYNSPCGVLVLPVPAGVPSMKAAVHRCYGSPEVITVVDVPKPSPKENEVLVKIHAASVNALDWHSLRGEPYFMRLDGGIGAPKDGHLGVDYAGIVEAVGKKVTRFRPGDEVFGGTGRGSFAEYVSTRDDWAIERKPANLTFEQAAAVPVAAITALQAVRDQAHVRAGQKVLVNGASGGVGTFAVQIAKAFGAEVTAVCSTRNVETARSIGADHVVDYTKEDFTKSGRRYDVIIDIAGSHSMLDYRRVLPPDGIVVIVGSNNKGAWIGPMSGALEAMLLSPFLSQRAGLFVARLNAQDMTVLADLLGSGKLTPVIDRRLTLTEVQDAVRYVEEGHARGKVVIHVD